MIIPIIVIISGRSSDLSCSPFYDSNRSKRTIFFSFQNTVSLLFVFEVCVVYRSAPLLTYSSVYVSCRPHTCTKCNMVFFSLFSFRFSFKNYMTIPPFQSSPSALLLLLLGSSTIFCSTRLSVEMAIMVSSNPT